MKERGVPLPLIRWLAAFLNNRLAAVNLNNVLSRTKKMHQGLPQGSVLAPILFLFYINTLAEILPDDTVNSLFADDVTILASDPSPEKAQRKCQRTVNIVYEWAKEYKMYLSDKSEVTFFSTSTNEAKWRPTVKLGDSTLKFNSNRRLLGVFY